MRTNNPQRTVKSHASDNPNIKAEGSLMTPADADQKARGPGAQPRAAKAGAHPAPLLRAALRGAGVSGPAAVPPPSTPARRAARTLQWSCGCAPRRRPNWAQRGTRTRFTSMIVRLLFDEHTSDENSEAVFRRHHSHDTNHANDTGAPVAEFVTAVNRSPHIGRGRDGLLLYYGLLLQPRHLLPTDSPHAG